MESTKLKHYPISSRVRQLDRWMTHFIRVGGIGIIVAVLGIFLFILSQVIPLFRGANVLYDRSWLIPTNEYVVLDSDESGQIAWLVTRQGRLFCLNTITGEVTDQPLPLPLGERATCFSYNPAEKRLLVGTDKGFAREFYIRPAATGAELKVTGPVLIESFITHKISASGDAVIAADVQGNQTRRFGLFAYTTSTSLTVKAVRFQQQRSLIGSSQWKVIKEWDITDQFPVEPVRFAVGSRGDFAIAIRRDGKVAHVEASGDRAQITQQFFPFSALNSLSNVIAEYVLGGDSIVSANERGEMLGFSLFKHGDDGRRWGRTKQFPRVPSTPRAYSASQRNKSFIVGTDKHLSLRHFTTEAVRWESEWTNGVRLLTLGSKHNLFWILDKQNPPRLHRFCLHDPHAEASLKAFFGKIWYEGASDPGYTWQSTGGSDDFEPKLSMIPLIYGTFKGTFYALIFSTPIALLAALYVSQFLHPNLRRFIKPTLEIMASLPSVILGFLAALWLAPLLEERIPSVLLVLILVPVSAVLAGQIWVGLPREIRSKIPQGYEFLVLIPILIAVVFIAWEMGPWLEKRLFVVRNPQTGELTPDFRLWWSRTFNLPFEQRNALVVGFMMGFAVIPIIFTIAEDALSNVPHTLRSASLALGATRWQTAVRVVCPTASAGIFSAIMVGFGRAVGETMIVLMATGNTPIMSLNIFSGMRTLSANIAVELPEAPHHSTLYRTLFLGALLLFAMTFVVNTIAELLRHRLREKYKMT